MLSDVVIDIHPIDHNLVDNGIDAELFCSATCSPACAYDWYVTTYIWLYFRCHLCLFRPEKNIFCEIVAFNAKIVLEIFNSCIIGFFQTTMYY